jgi:hypothetical protein
VSRATLDFMVLCFSVGTGLTRDVEVLMHSTVSTCPQVGARCYPHFLGITKEMMSRGPQVEYMEYRGLKTQIKYLISTLTTIIHKCILFTIYRFERNL